MSLIRHDAENVTIIRDFSGPYRFLSNFWLVKINWQGVQFGSVEAAYQASKTNNLHEWAWISAMPPHEAKRAGRSVQMRPDWDEIKLEVMTELVALKFNASEHPELRAKLKSTAPARLVEGNNWGDQYWGVSRGFGHNHLGKILMAERSK